MPPPRPLDSYYLPAQIPLPVEKQPHHGISVYGRDSSIASNPAFFFKLCHCYRDLHRCRPHYTHGRQNVSARHVFSSVLSFHVCSELPQPLYYCASTTVLPLRRLVELASSLRFCSNPL
ncbi:hypothetical protein HN51_032417, partial [Arachis hypogaea]